MANMMILMLGPIQAESVLCQCLCSIPAAAAVLTMACSMVLRWWVVMASLKQMRSLGQ